MNILKTIADRKVKIMKTISQLTEILSNGKDTSKSPTMQEILQKQTELKQPLCEPLPPGVLPLKADLNSQKRLASRLYRDFHAMKTYGKEPESLESIISLFNESLAEYCGEEIFQAMHEHAKCSSEFPTPAEIISRIEMNRMAKKIADETRRKENLFLIETQKPEYVEKLKRYKAKGIPLTAEQQMVLEKAG